MGEIGDHHRDVENHKRSQAARAARGQKHHGQKRAVNNNSNNNKQNPQSNAPHQRCWDWMMVSGTNHYAKNRSAFSTYCRAPCKVGSTRVLGIGTVRLQMVRAPHDERTYTLVLNNVLHIPEAICNGISINPGFMIENNYQIDWTDNAIYNPDTDEPFFYGKMYCGLPRAVLAGNPQGKSYLKEDDFLSLSMYASKDELEALDRCVQDHSF